MKRTFTVAVVGAIIVTFSNAEDPWTPSPFCPFPSTDLVRSPYEGDCSKYWECYNGAWHPMDCQEGLEFNVAESSCDTPELANCDPAPAEDPGPAPECPFPSDELVYFPVATNCSKYWECFQGNRYLMSCPSGLYWNTDSNYCDYPANVDCTRGSTTSITTTPEETTTTTPGSSTHDPDCPYPSNVMTFLPHPDCTKYYQCYNGRKFVMSCPIGLYWEQATLSCVPKDKANCDRVSTTPSPDTTFPDTTFPITTSPSTSTTKNPTCEDQPDGTYLPHPTDCSKFYECVGGHTIEEQCPGDLFWNQEAHTCDYPENVSCNNKAAKWNFYNFYL